jgi:hypothetical protein
MGDRPREAQHETPVPADPPPTRDEQAMRRCDGCARLYVLVTGMERLCDDCAGWSGVGAGQ